MYEWRSPTADTDVLARDSPDCFAIGQAQRSHEGIFRVIANDGDMILVDHRRARVAPSDAVFADVDDTQITAPLQLSIQVIAMQSFRTEERHDVVAGDGHAGIGVGGLNMPSRPRLSFTRCLSPEFVACPFVVAQHHPTLLAVVVRRIGPPTTTDFQRRFSVAGDGGRQKYSIATDDRAGVTQPGNFGAPQHSLDVTGISVGIPFAPHRKSIRDSVTSRPAK